MDLEIYNAERLVESLDSFIMMVEDIRGNSWKAQLYDQEALGRLHEQLFAIKELADDYLYQKEHEDWFAHMTLARIREIASVLDAMYKQDETDTYETLYPQFFTIHSIVTGLGKK